MSGQPITARIERPVSPEKRQLAMRLIEAIRVTDPDSAVTVDADASHITVHIVSLNGDKYDCCAGRTGA